MNRNYLSIFRSVFDPELNKDGFIWRYQMYLHIDFDQYWYLAIWPKVYSNGYDFNLHFWLGFFHECEDIVKLLKNLHSYQGNEMFKEFGFFNPPKYESVVSSKGFQEVVEQYCNCVRNRLHKIHNPYDAYLFRRDYPTMWHSQVEYEDGVNLIHMLLHCQRRQEALNLISLMKKRVNNMVSFSYKYEQDMLVRWPKYYEEAKTRGEEARKKYQRIYEDIEFLENKILKDQYRQIIQETESLMRKNAEIRKRSFSRKEIERMEVGWSRRVIG